MLAKNSQEIRSSMMFRPEVVLSNPKRDHYNLFEDVKMRIAVSNKVEIIAFNI